MSAVLRRGLYAITADGSNGESTIQVAVAQALEGGAVAVQYRDKSEDHARRRREALELKALCGARGVPLIVNDDVELALVADADGVHLGRHDPALESARDRLGAEAIIGVSCYASLERAVEAERAGADYVAFGRFFPSATKPGAPPCPLSVLEAARDTLTVPVAAIGGITADNGATLLDAGADLLAVIDAVFGQADVRAAAARIAELFD
ncbi:MAG: thiamine phosphate synthase [Gammaproteobacteria bacterium]|nr:thiamine phosphate synthase [Gammaproteobacteria bacterium]MDH3411185.1 thiamine phosphate synthase [Gammaproteobacteria bacterium]